MWKSRRSTSAWYWPESTCACVTPTVAISGEVKMFEASRCGRSGLRASPSRWATAMRPCMAATEARASLPVQSPAA
ncbi:hypothetical protein GY12_17860 [Micrococcus luteus]|nr:hypothetical protein GY12_17860 [Micrococcus luteus]